MVQVANKGKGMGGKILRLGPSTGCARLLRSPPLIRVIRLFLWSSFAVAQGVLLRVILPVHIP